MLDKIRKNRITSSIILAVSAFIAAMIIWPLFDLFWAKVITHSDFAYAIIDYVIEPAIFGVIIGIISFITWKPETKIEKKAKKK